MSFNQYEKEPEPEPYIQPLIPNIYEPSPVVQLTSSLPFLVPDVIKM